MDAETELVAKLEKDRRHTRRVFFWLIMLAIGLPVIGIIIAYCYDCAPPDDADMRPKWTTVPLSENGLGQFQEWLEKNPVKELPRDDDVSLTKGTWKIEAAKKMIPDFQPALDEFDKLAKTDITKWRWKEGAAMASIKASFSHLAEMQKLANLTRHRMKILLAEAKPAEAAALGFELMRVGRGMQTEGALIHHLVAITVQSIGQKIVADVVKASPSYLPDPAVWKKFMAECELQTDAPAFAFKAEYEVCRNLMVDIKSGKLKGTYLSGLTGSPAWSLMLTIGVRPNRTLRTYLDFQRPIVLAAEKGFASLSAAVEQQVGRIRSLRSDSWAMTCMFLCGNPGGEFIVTMNLPAFSKIGESFYSNIALHRLTFTQFALREYELANGKLPATLDELVPKHLPAVPVDPFDDKPLRWDVAKKILYSIGSDMKDNAGDINDEKPAKGKDIGMNYWWAKAPAAP